MFPNQDLGGGTTHALEESKEDALVVEIFEIGKVSRCGSCASDETFVDLREANAFRRSTLRAIVFFLVFSTLKSTAAIVLSTLGLFNSGSAISELYFV